MQGWIKLHRKILEWDWYDCHNTKLLFIHLLLKVNTKRKKWRGEVIEAGEYLTSIEKLATETGLTVSQVRTALKNLEQTDDISLARSKKGYYSIVTVVSWNKYQHQSQGDNKAFDKPIAKSSQTDSKPLASTKEEEEGKEGKKIFSPANQNFGDAITYNIKTQHELIYDQATLESIAIKAGFTLEQIEEASIHFRLAKLEEGKITGTLDQYRAGLYRYCINAKDKFKKQKPGRYA